MGCFDYRKADEETKEVPAIDMESLLRAYQERNELKEKLSRYERAEKENKLVFLSEPMLPVVRSDDPNDSDVYCPACGYDLSGSWDDCPADEYRRMYQCPKCGQSINDMACNTHPCP